MLRVFATVVRLLRAVTALTALVALVGGVPWLLATVAGWPLDWIGWRHPAQVPALSEVAVAVTSPWSDEMLFALIACLGWVLWLTFLRDVIAEVIEASAAATAARHGRRRYARTGRGPVRWVAAVLVGAIVGTILADSLHAGTPASAAAAENAAAHRPAVAVAPVQSFPASAHQAIHERTTATSQTPAHRHGDDIPSWAKDAPGGVHHVKANDNLWDIADSALGDPHRWREIYVLNRGHEQANGYALTDPDEIHVGWVLALPARDDTTPPAETTPGPDTSRPADPPTVTAPAPTPPAEAAPAPGPTTAPPSTPATSASPTPTTSTTAPESTTPESTTDEREHPTHGVSLPSQGWISLGLAATIAAVAALLRLQRRRRARLIFASPARTRPEPSLVPEGLTAADAVGSRSFTLDPASPDYVLVAPPAVPAPIGHTATGDELSLYDLPGPGVALSGDGATAAARAILASALATGVLEPVDARPVVVTTTALLARLLPGSAPLVGLDPAGNSFDGERLIVLSDIAAAVTHAEEEMIGRRRLLDTFDADTVTALNARTDHAENQPAYVLLIEGTERHAARLAAVGAHRHALHLHPITLGITAGMAPVEVAADGTLTHPDAGADRLATLAADDLAGVLAMLGEATARPETGADLDVDLPTTRDDVPADADDIPQPADTGATLVALRVLGPVEVTTVAGPITTGMRSGSYAALALLAAHPHGRTLGQITDALYPDTDPAVAIKRVRTDITTTRRVLRAATKEREPKFIEYDEGTGLYRLDPNTITVDLWQMLTALNQASNTADDAEALAALEHATQLYRGDFADGHDRAWVTDYATSYRHQVLTAYARIAEILEPDQPDKATACLDEALRLDPVNEELYQRLMRIQGRQHRPDAVRRTLRLLEERLADLGAEPSEATRRLAARQFTPAATAGRI